MKIRVNFTYHRQPYEFVRDIEELDRNYQDEPYAYILEDCAEFDYGGFEINLLKDENGNLIHEGYVNVFEDWDDVEPMTQVIDLQVTFVHEI